MKFYKLFLSSVLALITLICSYSVTAEKSYIEQYDESIKNSVPVKCYVEYRGGGDDIRLAIGDFDNPNQARQLLLNQAVVINKANKKQKKIVFKVKECVNETDNFTNARAKKLDDVMPR